MAVTLTQPQKDSLKAAVIAYKQALNQRDNAEQNLAAKQANVRSAFNILCAAATVDVAGTPVVVSPFRIGAKVYEIIGITLVEADDIVDAT